MSVSLQHIAGSTLLKALPPEGVPVNIWTMDAL